MGTIPKNFNVKITLFNDDYAFGNGVFRLLLLTLEYSSLNKACKEMRMSYSKAYKIIQRAEKDLGYKLLIGKTGGTGGGGSELTAEAMELVKFFNRLKANTEKFVKMQMEEEIKSKKSI
ncbi:MAG: LysR family transcriptional regulator [Peptoniphilaceae bacterium]|uniref:winged helix-turn-helix domain-containing protein n=1 Tax=Parvimonas sp. TaxID=1944660 RepID=UPI0025D82183|nr:LysR family transcriptional regulator [Parvimonas sp.]MCI5996726.1 LysR family transcriptional regulator [Parvimonas sp.]MDD7764529.1 LysR family transcriptional regulator [Peptoniphilaceae bacterium]MDY3050453.1 LysR family transcriptional regulator [Parvimonas sp.]